MTDPHRARNLVLVSLAGLGIAVAVMALLVANADSLRTLV